MSRGAEACSARVLRRRPFEARCYHASRGRRAALLESSYSFRYPAVHPDPGAKAEPARRQKCPVCGARRAAVPVCAPSMLTRTTSVSARESAVHWYYVRAASEIAWVHEVRVSKGAAADPSPQVAQSLVAPSYFRSAGGRGRPTARVCLVLIIAAGNARAYPFRVAFQTAHPLDVLSKGQR